MCFCQFSPRRVRNWLRGGDAERRYRKLDWTHAGTIPRFALDPDGKTPHDAVIFYKEL